MKRFKNILFAYDGKPGREQIFNRAVRLAQSNSALLTVIQVLKYYPFGAELLVEAQGFEEIPKSDRDETEEQLKRFRSAAKAKGVELTTRVLWGTPFLEIIREVLKRSHDLVMVGIESNDGMEGMLLGSTAMRLMRKCPCPVWAVKPTHGRQFDRILAAVDPAPFDEKMNDLDIKIMALATSLARSQGSTLHVVNCWSRNREKTFRARSRLKQAVVDDLLKETRKAHETRVKELLERFSLDYRSSKVHLLEGKPSQLIVDLAKKKQVELVVMGTVARTGIAGFLIGNTAEKVLNHLECSVLAVKPDGFKTPVEVE